MVAMQVKQTCRYLHFHSFQFKAEMSSWSGYSAQAILLPYPASSLMLTLLYTSLLVFCYLLHQVQPLVDVMCKLCGGCFGPVLHTGPGRHWYVLVLTAVCCCCVYGRITCPLHVRLELHLERVAVCLACILAGCSLHTIFDYSLRAPNMKGFLPATKWRAS